VRTGGSGFTAGPTAGAGGAGISLFNHWNISYSAAVAVAVVFKLAMLVIRRVLEALGVVVQVVRQHATAPSGTANTGGGGGGGSDNSGVGGAGGSGVVILSSTKPAATVTGSPYCYVCRWADNLHVYRIRHDYVLRLYGTLCTTR
jgi:hypothetical protein